MTDKEKIELLQQQVTKLMAEKDAARLDKTVYTVPEAARLLRVTPKTVYNYIAKGEIETVKIGRVKVLGASLRAKLGIQ